MNLINIKVKQECAKDFINEINKNKISNEFLKKCRKSASIFKKGEDNMKKSDLKNGMSFECRGKAKYFIINGKIYRDKGSLVPTGVFEERMKGYSEDLLVLHSDGKMDIMKIYDIDNKLIWEREEIDWSKIPKDTEVLVKNYNDSYWNKEYFNSYSGGKYYTYMEGRTAWSNNSGTLVCWDECKLAEVSKNKVTAEELQNLYDNICLEYDGSCSHCRYKTSQEDCQFHWLLDNYNVSPK